MAKASKWKARLARLASMDRHELFDRVRQNVTARADVFRYRTGSNFVSQSQLGESVTLGRFFFTPAEIPALSTELKQVFPAQADEIVSRAERICRHRFDLLGFANLDYGAEIDWHYDAVHDKRAPRKPWFKVKYLDFDEVGDSKITWELNRHQHFVTLAKAYTLTGDDKFVREIFTQWAHWHEENPYPIGINWASSLEIAYRSLSWIWTFFLLQECPLFTIQLRKQWEAALNLNGRHIETYLSTYFSPNTHLLGEALALFFLGTLFPHLHSAARWQRRGWEILQSEAAKQVRKDGFYFEQSTYYHVYALDIFLHARILAELNQVAISPIFDQTLQLMLNALLLMGRAGIAPGFGDDDGGRIFDPLRNQAEHILDPLATGAVLYRRGDFKFVTGGAREETLWLLGVKGLAQFDSLASTEPSANSTALRESGFYLMADETSGEQLLIDAGPLGAGSGGHGHADALSICLVRDGRNLLIDPGTYEYVGRDGERDRFRGTGAHNTMQVDGLDQAESIGPFSWKNFPQVRIEQWVNGRQFDLFHGSHDGYSRLPSPVMHHRWVFHRKKKFWLVRDRAEGNGSHQLDIEWHIAPTLSPVNSKQCAFADQRERLALLTTDGNDWSRSVRRDYWSPAYGHKEPASVVSFGATVDLPADFVTLLITEQNFEAHLGQLVRVDQSNRDPVDSENICGYQYSNGRQEQSFFFADQPLADLCFADQPGAWTLGAWSSDASFLYWSFDSETEERALILCCGSYADFEGRRVITCEKRVSYVEALHSGTTVELFSSDPEQVTLHMPIDRFEANEHLTAPGKDPERPGH
jgi:Heparinase II/III-like protein/Heparinase II/III N-terminus